MVVGLMEPVDAEGDDGWSWGRVSGSLAGPYLESDKAECQFTGRQFTRVFFRASTNDRMEEICLALVVFDFAVAGMSSRLAATLIVLEGFEVPSRNGPKIESCPSFVYPCPSVDVLLFAASGKLRLCPSEVPRASVGGNLVDLQRKKVWGADGKNGRPELDGS